MSKKNYRLISLNGGANANESEQDMLSDIIVKLLAYRTDIKMFHWQTKSFPQHKISDELLTSIDNLTDQLVEVLCGLYNFRPDINQQKFIQVKNVKNLDELSNTSKIIINDLRSDNLLFNNTEIANIRDEMLSAIEKALYLFSFN